MKELAIGEEIRIRCVEDDGTTCRGCFFYSYGCGSGDCCCKERRKDGKNVHFELVED